MYSFSCTLQHIYGMVYKTNVQHKESQWNQALRKSYCSSFRSCLCMSPWLNPLLFSRSNHYSDFCDSPSLCPARRQGCYIITHWVRRGIRPTSKWILVRFGTRWATTGTATTKLFLKTKGTPRNIPVLITCMSALFSSKYFLISNMSYIN